MDLDLHVSRFDWAGGPAGIGPGVATLARAAEEIGVRTLSFMDHWFQIDRTSPASDPMLEGYTALGFVAGLTQRLRLRMLATGVTYRHPGLLAKTVTTLDVLSGGRAELGIGVAWYEREHRGLGVPFPPTRERFERLDEAIRICLQMWSPDDGPFEGRHYQLAETIGSPLPVSQPRPRILIGGGGERKTLRLVARYADACNFYGGTDVVAHKIDVLRGHCDAVGRDRAEIEVTAILAATDDDGVDDVVRRAEDLAGIGVATVIVGPVGAEPVRFLETVFGPVRERLGGVTPSPW